MVAYLDSSANMGLHRTVRKVPNTSTRTCMAAQKMTDT